MRKAFMEALVQCAREDAKLWLLTGDLGYGVLDAFAAAFPQRFVNVGVAEQNMIGVAAGLALSGKNVFVYSIANFPTFRCLEQIRNDVCFHRANVKIVAVGGGYVYGTHGYTHHAVEDLAIMRALPEMVVAAPGDPAEAAIITRTLAARPGPAFLRLGKAGDVRVHGDLAAFPLGQALTVRRGDDATIICTGGMLKTAVDAAEGLATQGLGVGVISMPYLKPLDGDAILAAARHSRAIVTAEEHSITGGLGSAVAEVLAESLAAGTLGVMPKFRRFGVADALHHEVGSQSFLVSRLGDLGQVVRETLG